MYSLIPVCLASFVFGIFLGFIYVGDVWRDNGEEERSGSDRREEQEDENEDDSVTDNSSESGGDNNENDNNEEEDPLDDSYDQPAEDGMEPSNIEQDDYCGPQECPCPCSY